MCYFRIYLNSKNKVSIVQMGECDEIDYDQNRFLSSERFNSEDDAISYLEENENNLPSYVENPYSKKVKGILDSKKSWY